MTSDLSLDDAFQEALQLRLKKQPDRAAELFRRFLDGRRDQADDPRVARAYSCALFCVAGRKDWMQVEALARESIEYVPELSDGFQYLGEALWHLEREDEARDALRRAIELNPNQVEARAILAVINRGRVATRRKRRINPWPTQQAAFSEPKSVIRKHLLKGRDADRFIRPDTVFMTFGSCFAENLAIHLRKLGYKVNSEIIGEEVNSTYANRYLLKWIEHGPVDAPTRTMEETYGPSMRERFRDMIAQSDAVVLTLGVAPCFFDDAGEFVFLSSRSRTGLGFLQSQMTMRTTTVAENVENVHAIIDAVMRLSGRRPRIVLTVSPVPLLATTELDSAVIADCLSKSTLRLACNQIVEERAADGAIYWPSFEIVRWLGVHFDPSLGRVFGDRDGSTRHVSQWLIQMIMELFIEEHAPMPEAVAG
jgi:hypothetical protein